MTSHKLVIQDVQFSYKKQVDLKIQNAVFHAGNITAIIGRNGAGKSTFASVLCGMLKNKKGSISMDGVDLSSQKRIPISYMVMQEVNHQLFTDSVEKEVTLGVQNPAPEKLADVFVKMDISELRCRHPMTLSGGQKQRVAVAAAMFCGKKILIFDEPTSGLDFSHMLQTAELLKQLKTPNTFVFVITHDYEFILSACDNVVQIKQGGIFDLYPPDSIGESKLRRFYQIDY